MLNEDITTVESVLSMKPNYEGTTPPALELNGTFVVYVVDVYIVCFFSTVLPIQHMLGHPDVQLVSVKINGTPVPSDNYTVQPKLLTLTSPPAGAFSLEIVVHIKPQENTALEGLYKSGGNYCTQCEAQGFRHITYFLDRPDVMAKYTTRIEGDASLYPVLLGNGNLVESGDLDNGRCAGVGGVCSWWCVCKTSTCKGTHTNDTATKTHLLQHPHAHVHVHTHSFLLEKKTLKEKND